MIFKVSKKKPDFKHGVPAGTYTAEITAIEESKTYRDGDAIVIVYTLADPRGRNHEFKETIVLNEGNPRTSDFIDFYEQLLGEFSDVVELVGAKCEVEIRKCDTDTGTFSNIVERRIIV